MSEQNIQRIGNACCGCAACAERCPTGAIAMVEDREGFLTSQVDEGRCTSCGLCLTGCPSIAPYPVQAPQRALAAYLQDEGALQASSSGALFTALARTVLATGGLIVGAGWKDDLTVCLSGASSADELAPLRGSKYVQADARGAYHLTEQALKAGREVLFAACPCQVAALKKGLRVSQERLYTIDILCHGVPSPRLFSQYIKYLGQKAGAPVTAYRFRAKTFGWGMGFAYRAGGKWRARRSIRDPYMRAFLRGATYRDSCYRCHYAQMQRAGDLTLGDYWGILQEHPAFYSKKGVSCLLVNTNKGQALLRLTDGLVTQESTPEKIARHNVNLTRPTARPNGRDRAYQHVFDHDPQLALSTLHSRPTMQELVKAYIPTSWKAALSKLKGAKR